MDYSMQSVMAYQCKLIERMRNKAYKKLAERVENGTLHLFVARDILSHEKIYLLSAKDGRKRVIMGSANMSAAAFEGRQRENICYMDGDEAFDWYIQWIFVETENGGQIRYLNPGQAPNVGFELGSEKPVAVYAYCNLHGLWMTKL